MAVCRPVPSKCCGCFRCNAATNYLTTIGWLPVLWGNAAEWGGREWFPAITAAGLQYFAWVYSLDLYSRLSTELTLQFTVGNPVVATFDDIATAKAWLKQM